VRRAIAHDPPVHADVGVLLAPAGQLLPEPSVGAALLLLERHHDPQR
jgi:hypothetical protein